MMDTIQEALTKTTTKDVVRKNCNNCQGEGVVAIYAGYWSHNKEYYLHNGYCYGDIGTMMCKECNGAGVVDYKIVTKEI